MRLALGVLILVLGVLLARLCVFTVDRTEFVYLTQFGRHVATYDGAGEDAGLHVKWPWPIQSVQRLDRRLQYFDLPGAELLTRDPKRNTIDKTLTIDAYVCWRIADADGVDRFIRTRRHAGRRSGHPRPAAQQRAGAAVGEMELDDLISVETGQGRRRPAATARGREARRTAASSCSKEMAGTRVRHRDGGHSAAAAEPSAGGARGHLRPHPQRARQEGGRLPERGRAPGRRHRSKSDYEVAELTHRGRGRVDPAARPGRRRGRPHPQRGAGERPAVLRLPQEAGRVSAHPRRQQDACCCSRRTASCSTCCSSRRSRAGREPPHAEDGRAVTMRHAACAPSCSWCCWSRSGYGLTGVVAGAARRARRGAPLRPRAAGQAGAGPVGRPALGHGPRGSRAVDRVQSVAVGYSDEDTRRVTSCRPANC